jgi:hypothetical protein
VPFGHFISTGQPPNTPAGQKKIYSAGGEKYSRFSLPPVVKNKKHRILQPISCSSSF